MSFVGFMDNLVEVVGGLLLLEYVVWNDSCSAEVVRGSVCCEDHVGCGEELLRGRYGFVCPNVGCLFYLDVES